MAWFHHPAGPAVAHWAPTNHMMESQRALECGCRELNGPEPRRGRCKMSHFSENFWDKLLVRSNVWPLLKAVWDTLL